MHTLCGVSGEARLVSARTVFCYVWQHPPDCSPVIPGSSGLALLHSIQPIPTNQPRHLSDYFSLTVEVREEFIRTGPSISRLSIFSLTNDGSEIARARTTDLLRRKLMFYPRATAPPTNRTDTQAGNCSKSEQGKIPSLLLPTLPIPIHLPQSLAPAPAPPVMLEGLHFPGLHLAPSINSLPIRPAPLAATGSRESPATERNLCRPSLASQNQSQVGEARQPTSQANPPSHTSPPTKASRPLWNPALDLTVSSSHSSPRKADTAESLPLVTSNLHPGTAMTVTSCSISSSPSGDAPKKESVEKEETLSRLNNAPSETTASSSVLKRNEASVTSKEDSDIIEPNVPPETTRKKRKEPAAPRGTSPCQTKRVAHRQEQNITDTRERPVAKSPEVKVVDDTQTSPLQNSRPFVGDMRGDAGLGCVTTDSQTYQHFHHQRRLALLASNLLHMGAQGHAGILGPHSHPHLIAPQLQHLHHSHPQIQACTPAALQHHPGLSFNSALAIAKSRQVLERLSSSSAFANSSPSLSGARNQHHHNHGNPQQNHQHCHHHPHIERMQACPPQIPQAHQPKQDRKEGHPIIPCSSSSSSLPFLPHLPKAEKLHPPHSLAIQNALVLAQSRALMERVNASHLLPSSGLTIDPLLPNHPHHHNHNNHPNHPQPGLLSPHGGNAPVGAGSLVSAAAGLGMGVAMNGVAPGAGSYGRKLFPCPQCRYTTDRRNNLKRHMLTMHQTSSKMLECCGILFSTKASLREHAMIFHYHGYTCYFCGRRFCRKALLKRHLSVHNGQKDFVCTVCDYATSHKSNLERHRKVHSRQEGDDGKDGEDGELMDSSGEFPTRYHDVYFRLPSLR
ncbi:hypothetical protein EGW08_014887 [Elysia chlorotica]|uniref:C2H2-type domain-containing protein n=1 Tax=Elysia chlorotica TaxID=188477 RepID=A0A433T724_ELYCH|nr:hypothetical protein EGW08_014887 [Elysia chlorotica]